MNTLPVFNRHEHPTPRVLVADQMSPEFADVLGKGNFDVRQQKFPTTADVLAAIRDQAVQYLVVRSATKIKGPSFHGAQIPASFVGIGRAGVEGDNIEIQAAVEKGILVQNTPKASTESVGEQALTLALAVLKNIARNTVATQKGEWQKELTEEIRGKRVLIIGAGNIGTDAAAKFHALGCRVEAVDDAPDKASGFAYGVSARGKAGHFIHPDDADQMHGEPYLPIHNLDALHDLLGKADIVSVHVPSGRLVLDREAIERLRKGAVVLNTSRASAIDYEALIEGIKNKRLRVGLDVLPTEKDEFYKDPYVQELIALQAQGYNIVITHHTAGNTVEAQDRIAQELARGITKLFGGDIVNGVNVPATARPRQDRGQPRVVVINRDRKGAIAKVSDALGVAGHNLREVGFSAAPTVMREAKMDILGFDLADGTPKTPAQTAESVVDALKKLFRDDPVAQELLIKGFVF